MSDMTDTPASKSPPAQSSVNDDPLQVIDLIEEAMQLVVDSSPAVVEEAHNLEALAESYSSYVTAYTESFANAWDASMQAYQTEVDAWQAAVAKYKAPNPFSDNSQAQQQAIAALMKGINAAADDAAKGAPAPTKTKPPGAVSGAAKKPQG